MRALARSERAAAAVRELGAEPAPGDLTDANAMAAGADGAAVAFHLAAHLGQWGAAHGVRARERHRHGERARCMCPGGRRALRALRHGGRADGRRAARERGRERATPAGLEALYSATKAQAEEAVLARGPGGLRNRVRASAPRVGGAGDTTLLPGILAAVESGRFAWIGGGGHRTSTTHVDNAVEGLLLAAERGRHGEAYFVTDGEPVVFRAFVSELISTQGLQPPGRSLPDWAARGRGRRLRARVAAPAAEGRAAAHPPCLLAVRPRVHARHLEGQERARLRAATVDRGGARRDARTGLGRRRSARANARGPAQARRGARLEGRDRVGAR